MTPSMLTASPPTQSTRSAEFFEMLSKVLLRCWVFGAAFLVVWFAAYLLAGDFIHGAHGDMFGLSGHELDLIFYCGMGLLKVLVILFFLFPWIAIRMVLRKAHA